MRFPVALMIFVTGVYRVGFGASSSSNDPVDDPSKKLIPITQIQLCYKGDLVINTKEEENTGAKKKPGAVYKADDEWTGDKFDKQSIEPQFWLDCRFVNGQISQCFELMPYSSDLPIDKPLLLDDRVEWELENPTDRKKSISLKGNQVVLIVSKRTIGKGDQKYLAYKVLTLTTLPSSPSLKIIFSYTKDGLNVEHSYTARRNS